MAKRERVQFTCRAESTSIAATVFRFLGVGQGKLQQHRQRKEKAIDALFAFWLPYALVEAKTDPVEVRRAAEQSVRSLMRQAELLCLEFGIQTPQSTVAHATRVVPVDSPQTTQPVYETPAPAIPNRPAGVWVKGTDVEIDDLLGDLA